MWQSSLPQWNLKWSRRPRHLGAFPKCSQKCRLDWKELGASCRSILCAKCSIGPNCLPFLPRCSDCGPHTKCWPVSDWVRCLWCRTLLLVEFQPDKRPWWRRASPVPCSIWHRPALGLSKNFWRQWPFRTDVERPLQFSTSSMPGLCRRLDLSVHEIVWCNLPVWNAPKFRALKLHQKVNQRSHNWGSSNVQDDFLNATLCLAEPREQQNISSVDQSGKHVRDCWVSHPRTRRAMSGIIRSGSGPRRQSTLSRLSRHRIHGVSTQVSWETTCNI